MNAGARLAGFDSSAALVELLLRCGIRTTLTEARERLGAVEGTGALLKCLHGFGLNARAVVAHNDLREIQGPSLILLNDSSWIVVESRKNRGYQVLDRTGRYVMTEVCLRKHVVLLVTDVVSTSFGGHGIWSVGAAMLKEHRATLLLGFALPSAFLMAVAVIGTELQGKVLGQVLPDAAEAQLQLLAILIFLMGLCTAGLGLGRDRTVLAVFARSEFKLKSILLDRFLRANLEMIQSKTLGERLQGFSGVSAARGILGERVLGSLVDGVLALGFLAAIGAKSVTFMLVTLAGGVVIFLITLYVAKRQASLQLVEIDAQAKQRGFLTEVISGVRQIKASGAQKQVFQSWCGKLNKELEANLERQRSTLTLEVGSQAVQAFLVVLVLIWAAHHVLTGTLAMGHFFAIVLLNDRFVAAVIGSANSFLALIMLRAQLNETNKGLMMASFDHERSSQLRGVISISVKNLSFSYSDDSGQVLKDVSFSLPNGGFYKLEGASGRGKSTLLKIISGLYIAKSGSVRISGRDPRAVQTEILYLPQHFQLYRGSLLENLEILSGGASPEDVIRSAIRSGLDAQIKRLPMGYNTQVSHGGQSFSGGQRQMIALTAALASHRRLLLLDEPMANLDALTAKNYMELLLSTDKVVIFTGHNVDHVSWPKCGEVIEISTNLAVRSYG